MPLPFSDWHFSDRDLPRTFIRTTHWSNGDVTDREMETTINGMREFLGIQHRRVINGPGIDFVKFSYNGRCYLILSKPK